MGTTPNHSWPTPTDEDWLEMGAYSIEQLANAADATLEWETGAVISRADAAGAAGTSPGRIAFPGPQPLMVNFSYAAGVLTYTGPGPRLFTVSVEVQIQTGGATSCSSAVELRTNDVAFSGSYHGISTPTATVGEWDHVHRVNDTLRMVPGQTLDVLATATPAGSVNITGIRVFPVGPVQ